ncbi:hypothetical protein [Aurantibacillus circumpalustris]|uniref:hypothetical protein n=1 Tax=Aurantibacillus circumpalustris TaxID=3036359 RepID=UPI00295ADC5D|nr:hypothetical protein [Aurantibacillus circumpalustris]
MKNSLILASLFCLSVSYGQIKSGNVFFGPSIKFSTNDQSNESLPNNQNQSKNSSVGFDSYLRAGYFLKDNFVVGLMGGYGASSAKYEQKGIDYTRNGKDYSNSTSFGVFTRLYKLTNQNKLGVFGQLTATYGFGKSNSTSISESSIYPSMTNKWTGEGDQWGLNVGLQTGLVYFITEKIGIEMSFGNLYYNNSTNQSYSNGVKTIKTKSSGLNLDLGLRSLYLGFNIYFGGKKA